MKRDSTVSAEVIQDSARPDSAEGDHRPAPSLVPLSPSDGPFRNMLTIPEAGSGYLAEAKREVQTSAMRRLESLEQMHRKLVEQAEQIVGAARRDLALHDVAVSATKIRGKVYHLYRRPGRTPSLLFSILDPDEYASADPRARHLATYRLNEDSSWSRHDEDDAAFAPEPWLDELLSND